MKRTSLFLLVGLACAAAPQKVSSGNADTAVIAEGTTKVTANAAATAPSLEPPTLRLGDTVTPSSYGIELTLIPTEKTFAGKVTIDVIFNQASQIMWLNSKKIKVESAVITSAGKTMAAKILDGGDDYVGFVFPETVAPGKARIEIVYQGELSKDLTSGLFRQLEEDDWYIFTQFEATDARRAFPSFDEPAYKVLYQLTLNVKQEHMALSNTPIEKETKGANGMKSVRFKQTKPLPTYLLAMAVGPFEAVDGGRVGRNNVPHRIIVPKGKKAQAAYALQSTGPILALLEDYFGTAYPYEKLDQIAVPSFGGAMEHPGLVTYSQRLILSKPQEDTIRRQRRFANVCTHELAHMWFGNLVTMVWWNDIWLNESFATWMAQKIVAKWQPGWDGDISRVSSRNRAMGSDSLKSARKIRQPIKSRHDIANAFDGITYGKGAAVLAMFESWIGEDAMRKGVRAYMKKHAFENATAEDFLAALGTAGGGEVAKAFTTFIDQPGVPEITVELSCKAKPTLLLSQKRYLPQGSKANANAIWRVPVCVQYRIGKKSHRQCTLLSAKSAEMPLRDATACPTWILANDNMAGYYRVRYKGELLQSLLTQTDERLDVAERVGIINDMKAQVTAGAMDTASTLALIPVLLREKNRHIVSSSVGLVSGLSDDLVPSKLRANRARFIRKNYGRLAKKLGFKARKKDGTDEKLLRPTLLSLVAGHGQDKALVNQAKRLTNQWLKNPKAIDPNMVGVVLKISAKNSGQALWSRLYAKAKGNKDRKLRGQLLRAMGQFVSPAQVKRNLAFVLTTEFELRESLGFLFGALGDERTRQPAYDFVKNNYDALKKRIPGPFAAYLPSAAGAFCDEEHAKDAEEFFTPRMANVTGGPRSLKQTIERIRLCAAQRQAHQASVVAFLKKY